MLTSKNLLSVISFVSGQPEDAILGNSRARSLVLCRHVYYHIGRKKMGLKLKQIGLFMNRDHTTIIHGLNKIDDMIFIKDEITMQFINQVNQCITEKYLIPTRLMVTIPHEQNDQNIIQWLTLNGCEIDRINLNFDAMHT